MGTRATTSRRAAHIETRRAINPAGFNVPYLPCPMSPRPYIRRPYLPCPMSPRPYIRRPYLPCPMSPRVPRVPRISGHSATIP